MGYFYQEGKYIERNIKKSIEHYKEASSFNNHFAKNNLGIIYKNGIGEISKNIGYAIEYFDESIRRYNDEVSMYNLAHIYIYEEGMKEKINKAIDLLIQSINQHFSPSNILLMIALIKKYSCIFDNELFLKKIYDEYKTNDYMYGYMHNYVISKQVMKQIFNQQEKKRNISNSFYEGFGIDTL